jgi:hypothetical protein
MTTTAPERPNRAERPIPQAHWGAWRNEVVRRQNINRVVATRQAELNEQLSAVDEDHDAITDTSTE